MRCKLAIILLVLGLASAGLCASDESPFNVDFFCGWGGCYRPMEWTAVEIGITSTLTEPFQGSIVLSAQQDELNTLNIVHEFVLTPDMPLHVPLVTKFAFAANKCDLKIVDGGRRRTIWRKEYGLWDFSVQNRVLTAVNETDLLVGLIGRRTFGVLQLPKQAVCSAWQNPEQRLEGQVFLKDKLPRGAPWDWTGYASLDLLILYDPDWSQFSRHQVDAIAQWVSNGGRLLIVLGTHPLAADNAVGSMLPIEIGQIRQVMLGGDTLRRLGLRDDRDEALSCWALSARRGARLVTGWGDDPNAYVYASGYADFGRVGVLGFDPTGLSEGQIANSSRFWVRRIAALLEDTEPSAIDLTRSVQVDPGRRQPYRQLAPASGPVSRTIRFVEDVEKTLNERSSMYQYQLGSKYNASNAVMEYLYETIRPLSIWWVILLLVALAVLLGPVDYIVLKRLDRLPLTWVTCAFWIVLFTVGAYYGVQAVRAGDMELRVVSVIDAVDDSNQVWSTDFCGLFAPRSDDYRLKGLMGNQWWSGIAPTQDYVSAYGQQGLTRNIYCLQRDGGNLPASLAVNIWTVQCLLKESAAQDFPFEARVMRDGEDVSGEIVNKSGSRILRGEIMFGNDRAVFVGDVPAHSSKQISGRLEPGQGWESRHYQMYTGRQRYPDSRRVSPDGRFRRRDAWFAQGCLQRTLAMKTYLDSGAAVVSVEYDQPPLGYQIDDRSCKYNHIHSARLVVFPEDRR